MAREPRESYDAAMQPQRPRPCSVVRRTVASAVMPADTTAATAVAAFLSGQVAADSAGHGRRSCVRNVEDQWTRALVALAHIFWRGDILQLEMELVSCQKQPLLHVEKRPEKER